LHDENERQIAAAFSLGVQVLAAQRVGMPRIEDSEGRVYVLDQDEAALGVRIDRFYDAAEAIEARGSGFAHIQKIATRLAKKAGVIEPWYSSLDRADSAEEKEIAKWADGDTVAAHIAYQIDYLCTGDQAKARSSVFNPTERAWLAESFGVRLVTITELAAMIR
jgi:hypothetical protein